jgi:hypothetical protein
MCCPGKLSFLPRVGMSQRWLIASALCSIRSPHNAPLLHRSRITKRPIEIPMKKFISTMLAVFAFATTVFSATENFSIYDLGHEDPNNTIETYLNYSTTECAYVTVTNGSDVDFLIEFNRGSQGTTGIYTTNNSTNTAVNLYAQNAIDYAYFTLDHLPPGAYTITVNGTASTSTLVYYY